MTINWPLICVLFCLSIPGVLIAMPRLIALLLPNNSIEIKRRFSRFAVTQTLFMVLVLSFAGSILSQTTGLSDPVLDGLLQGKVGLSGLQAILLPTFLYALIGLIVFCGLYYGLVGSLLDEHNLEVMRKLRAAIGEDGCVLYGGVVEEVIARYGLMNLLAFFLIFFTRQHNAGIIWTVILLSGLIWAVGQMPAYIAAGAVASRRFVYSILLLYVWQAIVFGFLFWQYGLISAILAHMLFHLGWARYDKA
ncbi:MAG: CPBP family intramembrane metalloprotease [Legionella sp.]|nr:MAG: CPBP family intramembrane metalloprotease [Legionella sp.]